jgi:drug/metabolite transporter (DMT)-like permease
MAFITPFFGPRSPIATAPTTPDGPPRTALALGAALTAFLAFTGMDAVIKTLSQTYPLTQVIALNALFGLVPVLVLAGRRGGLNALATRKPWLFVARGSLALAGAAGSVYAFSVLPMAMVYVIIFAAPLFVTALSVPVLKEPVGWRRWSAVLVGFAGVMVILRPGLGGMDWAMLAALGAALAFSGSALLIRRFGKGEQATAFTFWLLVPQVLVYGTVTLGTGAGIAPSLGDLALAALGGLLGGSASTLYAFAVKSAPAATVAPFQYSQLLWGILFGYLIWAEVPDQWVLIGGGIVVASGLYILHRETVVARRARRVAPPRPAKRPATAPPVAR